MSDSGPFSLDDAVPQAPAIPDETQRGRGMLSGQLPPGSPDWPAPEPASPLPSPRAYRRYHIETQTAPDVAPLPPKFRVRVKKHRLIALVLKELWEARGNVPVAMSRPCVYGVFSRPVGGLAPREELCVGCLRCTVQYPDVVQIYPNPQRRRLGDSYVTPEHVDTLLYEARTGRVPVHGAGYRGPFGGEGWDGLWTDMSEIVRPTRDGIHGREFISTAVDIGDKPAALCFDDRGQVVGSMPRVITAQVPFLFDLPPVSAAQSQLLVEILGEAARRVATLVMVPLSSVVRASLSGPHVVPVIAPDAWSWLDRVAWSPRMVVLEGWDQGRYDALRRRFPASIVCVRVPMDTDVLGLVERGARTLHLTADYHGYVGDRFAMDLILQAHQRLVDAGVREEVTLIGSGGISLAEHVPKALMCGLDAIALDVALAVALQARFIGECKDREAATLALPRLTTAWGVQRLMNLAASWRDQLLEILGAMGLRDVRRLRGEIGRCMFQRDLEREVFGVL